MTDVLSGAIGIELGEQRVRPLRQRGGEGVPERRSKVWRAWIAVERGGGMALATTYDDTELNADRE